MWSWKRSLVAGLRFGLLSMLLVGMFWLVWSFFGQVPNSEIFALSRWTDVIVLPLTVFFLTVYFGRVVLPALECLGSSAVADSLKILGFAFGIFSLVFTGLVDPLVAAIFATIIMGLTYAIGSAIEFLSGDSVPRMLEWVTDKLGWAMEKLKDFGHFLVAEDLNE